MGYVQMMFRCGGCGKMFSAHPNKVIGCQGRQYCKDCVDHANVKRKENGLPEIRYSPDTYEAVHDENEINWDGKTITVTI